MSDPYNTQQTEYNIDALTYDLPLLKRQVREFQRRVNNGGGFDAERDLVLAKEKLKRTEGEIRYLREKLERIREW